eukprot:3457015-Rhodomonas_salina.1
MGYSAWEAACGPLSCCMVFAGAQVVDDLRVRRSASRRGVAHCAAGRCVARAASWGRTTWTSATGWRGLWTWASRRWVGVACR